MFKRLAGALAALCLLVAAAAASVATTTTTLSTSAYTDLGAGPLMLSVNGGALVYQIADSQPSAGSTGIGLSLGQVPVALTTTSHVWALALSGPAVSAVTWPVTVTPATIYSGQQTATASAVALPSQALVNGVVITAKSTNTGVVYVGPSGVTSATGYPLAPGWSISYGVANLSAVFIVDSVTTDAVSFAGN